MNILALDLSLTATGYATTGPVKWGTFMPKGKTGMERFGLILNRIKELATGVDLVIVEDFAYGARGSSLFEIAGIGYLVRYWLFTQKIPFVTIPPSTLKKFVTGKGNSEKALVIREVFRRFGHEIDDNNAADAAGLLYLGMALTGAWEPTCDAQRDVVRDVLKKNPTLQGAPQC